MVNHCMRYHLVGILDYEASTTNMLEKYIDRDLPQPSAERSGRPERSKLSPCLEEGFLSKVVRDGPIAAQLSH
jgi:hypothetical protein